MAAYPLRWGSGLFPEIRLYLRTSTRSTEVVLSPLVQAVALSAALAVTGVLVYLGVGRMAYDRLIADREAAVVRAESANADLQDGLAELKDKLAEATRDLGQAQDRQSSLSQQSGLVRGLLSTTEAKLSALDEVRNRLSEQRGVVQQQLLSHSLEQAQRELFQLQAQRATLAARLSKIEADRAEEQDRVAQYKANLDVVAKRLQQLTVDRDNAASERDRMRARVGELERKLSQRETQQRDAEAKPVEPAPAPASPPQVRAPEPPEAVAEARRGVAGLGRRGLDEVVRVLASAGVDVEQLFSQFGLDHAEGGPFVAMPKDKAIDAGDRLAGVRGLVESLPLSAPLADYQLESGFGPRRDPFIGHSAFHTGVDFSAPYMSPVYATAPGTVTYAGYRSDYGKVVEIDHGNGISTLYAHLHRYTVADGQQVAAHAQIGFLGSSGRSSGPHVHYEVKVNGEPQDPEKFLGLAHLIPVAAR